MSAVTPELGMDRIAEPPNRDELGRLSNSVFAVDQNGRWLFLVRVFGSSSDAREYVEGLNSRRPPIKPIRALGPSGKMGVKGFVRDTVGPNFDLGSMGAYALVTGEKHLRLLNQ